MKLMDYRLDKYAINMEAKVSFFVRGNNPYNGIRKLLLRNGILKNDFGLRSAILSQRRLDRSTHLFQLSAHALQEMQVRQGIPFQGFKGEPAKAFEPRSVLVVSKDSQDPIHLATIASVRTTLRHLGIRHQAVDLKKIRPRHFRDKDLILPVGGDGTFLRAAQFVRGKTPFLGVVSDAQSVSSNPLGSWGHYLLLSAAEVEQALNLVSRGEYELSALTRLGAFLKRGRLTIAARLSLNEIFINELDSSSTARYLLTVNGLKEYMSDSGLLVATGAGSAANAWISNAEGLSFDPTSPLLQFRSREPARFSKDAAERDLLHGFAGEIEVESAMYRHPRVSIDGTAAHYPFPKGSKLMIRAANPLNFLVFPSIATKEMAEPERPIAEVDTVSRTFILTSQQVAEIDALPICASVPKGTKRQILFLQVSEDLGQLRLGRILKSGGAPLTEKDIELEAAVPNPTLLFPTAEIATLPAAERDIVFGLYTYGLRVTEYAGSIIEWDSSIDTNVWAPSIDTIIFENALLEHKLLGPQLTSIGEIGTGSGAITKLAVLKSPNLKEVTASDVDGNAIECMLRNVEPLLQDIDQQIILGKGVRRFGKVDLLMVNPPYLPEKETSGEVDQYRGLGLIEEVLREGKDHLNPGGSIVINYSSCASKEFEAWAEQYGWKVKPLSKVTVPLKIVRVYKDPEWLDFILEHGGLEIRNEVETGYRYWHTLNVVQLTPA